MTDADGTIETDAEPGRDDPGATRRCGRCLLRFPVPADVHPMELRNWWTCTNCTETLLPGRRRTPTTGSEQPGAPT